MKTVAFDENYRGVVELWIDSPVAYFQKVESNIKGLLGDQSKQHLKLATEKHLKSVAKLIEWAQKPSSRAQFHICRRQMIGTKFSSMVENKIEDLEFSDVRVEVSPIIPMELRLTNVRARMMSLRGVALSIAPNFLQMKRHQSFGRSILGIA